MKPKWPAVAVALVLFAGPPASAHRLDEYLQATLVSLEQDRLQAQMRLVPGVAVAAFVLTGIDSNGDGVLSETEQHAYANRVLHDLSLRMDGQVLTLHLVSAEFPALQDMKEGLGEIKIQFSADLPPAAPSRRLVFQNHHQSRIAAYLINCLVPASRDIRIVAQNRDERQSFYQLDYVQAGSALDPRRWLGLLAILLFARLAFLLHAK